MATNPPTPPSVGATYQEVLTRLATVSSRISDILRTLGIGTVLFCWGLFTADKGLAQNVADYHRLWVVATAAMAILGLLFDLLQAIVAYWVANRLRFHMERNNLAAAPYPYADKLYRSQTFFFAAKSVLMPVSAASIIALLAVMVSSPQPVSPVPTCCCCSTATATPTPPLPPSTHKEMNKLFLLPAPGFAPKNWHDPNKVEDLKKVLFEKAEKGDMLLLLGSADCTPIKKDREELNNTKLALNRASRVRDLLQAAGFGLEMPSEVLPQYAGCEANPSIRAVFPFLLRFREH